ncbi:hypothetical protein [Streptomyces sp. NPDC002580]|uniref:hypothetical protein n=1 Tax=Streptomyces sp. NPDC002580 TaxID=3364653 RepID=UPI0036BE89F1
MRNALGAFTVLLPVLLPWPSHRQEYADNVVGPSGAGTRPHLTAVAPHAAGPLRSWFDFRGPPADRTHPPAVEEAQPKTPAALSSPRSRTAHVSPSAAQPESAPPHLEYDGRAPFPSGGTTCERTGNERLSLTITVSIVFLPFLALGLAGWLSWGRLIHPVDVLLAAVLCAVTGLGVTVGSTGA